MTNVSHTMTYVQYYDMCASLRSHHSLRKESSGNQEGSTAAFVGKKAGKTKKKSPSEKFSPCTHCKRTNHKPEDCYFKDKDQGGAKKCFKCGQTWHFAKNCKSGEKKEAKAMIAFTNVTLTEIVSEKPSENKVLVARGSDTKQSWIVDSGASQHMCNNADMFQELSGTKKEESVFLGDSTKIPVKGSGKVELKMFKNGEKTGVCEVHDVLYVPELSRNLISVASCMCKGIDVHFYSKTKTCVIQKGQKTLGVAHLRRGLWELSCQAVQSGNATVNLTEMDNGKLWHWRFGHLHMGGIQKLQSKNMVRGLTLRQKEAQISCKECASGKLPAVPFPHHEDGVERDILSLVHSDLIGPIKPASLGGKSYILTFVDDKSRRAWCFPISEKSETLKIFKYWKRETEKQSGKMVKILRTDNGGEYMSGEFNDFLKEEGIIHQTTIPYTPQQNGVAERFNRTIMEMVRTMLISAKMPKSFWGEALLAATHIRNLSPTSATSGAKTPYEVFYGHKPTVEHLRVWGCEAQVLIPEEKRAKLDSRTWTGRFVGYATTQKGWRIWNPTTKKIEVARNVKFFEEELLDHSGHKEDEEELTWTETAQEKEREHEESHAQSEENVYLPEKFTVKTRNSFSPLISENEEEAVKLETPQRVQEPGSSRRSPCCPSKGTRKEV